MWVTLLQFRPSVSVSCFLFPHFLSPVNKLRKLSVLCSVISFRKYLCDGWKSMLWSVLSNPSHLSPNAGTHLCQVAGSESCLCFSQNVSMICHYLIFMPQQITFPLLWVRMMRQRDVLNNFLKIFLLISPIDFLLWP